MRAERRANNTFVLRGNNGREYFIKYIHNAEKPWNLFDEENSLYYETREDAEENAEKLEAYYERRAADDHRHRAGDDVPHSQSYH